MISLHDGEEIAAVPGPPKYITHPINHGSWENGDVSSHVTFISIFKEAKFREIKIIRLGETKTLI